MEKTTDELISFALTRLVIKNPFFGTLASRLKFEEAKPEVKVLQQATETQMGMTMTRQPVDTLATDGKTVFYNADFVRTLTSRQLSTALVEAVLYCVLHHPTRRGNREKDRYQKACRFEICEHLLKNNAEEFAKLSGAAKVNPYDWPEHFQPDYNEDFVGMVAEQIYNHLGGGGKGGGGGGCGSSSLCSVLDSPIDDPTEQEAEEAKWDIAIEQAAAVAESRGDLPGSLKHLVEKTKPKIPWTYHLKPFVRQFTKEDYSFAKPNMAAFIASEGEIILPSLWSEGLGKVVICVDTSGSIYAYKPLLDQFLAEIESIHRDLSPSELHFIVIDADVHDHRVFGPSDQLDLSVTGGGGTDFRPAFRLVSEQRIDPVCMLYFTDMDGAFPREKPHYPVLWINYARPQKAPFGTVIQAE
jgi:predicted metal-dependent peptidase